MEQENRTDQYHHDEFLDQLFIQIFDCLSDQRGAVIGRYNLDALGQTFFKGFQFLFYQFDGALCVFSKAHHHIGTDHFALAIKLCNAATHLWAGNNLGHILEL